MAFKNLDRARRRLKAIPIGARRAAKEQLAKNAAELVALQKRFVPVEKKDGGQLKATIRHKDVSNSTRIRQEVRAGGPATTKPVRKSKKGGAPTYDYALAQEFGTAEMEANPFFFPPYRAKRRAFKARLNRAVKKAIADAVTKP